MEHDELSRRDFLILAAAACTGCLAFNDAPAAANTELGQTIDAGPVSAFAADGVYDALREQGFFIVRRGEHLLALSAICTHRAFPLKAQPDHSFYCKRHGSTFSPDGHVTSGPARRDLPVLVTSVDANQHLLVSLPKK